MNPALLLFLSCSGSDPERAIVEAFDLSLDDGLGLPGLDLSDLVRTALLGAAVTRHCDGASEAAVAVAHDFSPSICASGAR